MHECDNENDISILTKGKTYLFIKNDLNVKCLKIFSKESDKVKRWNDRWFNPKIQEIEKQSKQSIAWSL